MGNKLSEGFLFIKKIVSQDYLFSIISKFLGVFIAFFYSVVLNRYLGAELKGEAAIITNYIAMISSFTCIGMYQAYPFYKKTDENIFYNFLNNMTSFYSLMFLALTLFAVFLPGLNTNLRVALVIVPVNSYVRHINYIVTIENPKTRNKSSILISVIDIFVVAFLWLFAKASYKSVVAFLVAQTLVNLIISFINLKSDLHKLRFTLSLIPKYAKFGLIPMVTLFLMTINYRVDILMMEHMAQITTAQIGIYSVGVSLAEKVWLIPDAIKDILLSRLCKGKDESEVAKAMRLNLAVVFIAILFVAIVSKVFIDFLYGAEYSGADRVTVIMLVGILGMVLYKMIYSYNISQGKRLVSLVFLLITSVANVIGNYILIPLMGIYGAAVASSVSYVICGGCFLIYFHRVSKISFAKLLIIQKEDFKMIKGFIKKSTKS